MELVKIVKMMNNIIKRIFIKRIFSVQYYYHLGNVYELYLSDDDGDHKYG